MPTFNAADIIGKTLIAKTNAPLKRIPMDDSPIIYNVSKGDVVGVVDTYLLPSADRNVIYWGFRDANNKVYYAPHQVGRFDVKELQSQGALTLEQQQQQQEEASMTTGDKIFRFLKNTLLVGALVYLGKQIIDKKL